jgi:hypothetical protein
VVQSTQLTWSAVTPIIQSHRKLAIAVLAVLFVVLGWWALDDPIAVTDWP